MAFKMTEEEYMKSLKKKRSAAKKKKDKRYNPFKDGRKPVGWDVGP